MAYNSKLTDEEGIELLRIWKTGQFKSYVATVKHCIDNVDMFKTKSYYGMIKILQGKNFPHIKNGTERKPRKFVINISDEDVKYIRVCLYIEPGIVETRRLANKYNTSIGYIRAIYYGKKRATIYPELIPKNIIKAQITR